MIELVTYMVILLELQIIILYGLIIRKYILLTKKKKKMEVHRVCYMGVLLSYYNYLLL